MFQTVERVENPGSRVHSRESKDQVWAAFMPVRAEGFFSRSFDIGVHRERRADISDAPSAAGSRYKFSIPTPVGQKTLQSSG